MDDGESQRLANELQQKMGKSMEEAVDSIDRQYLRPMQKRFFECGISCCNNESYDQRGLQTCISRCQQPLEQAEQVVQNEMENFQKRIERCFMDCQEKARDSMTGPQSRPQSEAQREMQGCIATCTNTHIDLIPSMLARMRSALSQIR